MKAVRFFYLINRYQRDFDYNICIASPYFSEVFNADHICTNSHMWGQTDRQTRSHTYRDSQTFPSVYFLQYISNKCVTQQHGAGQSVLSRESMVTLYTLQIYTSRLASSAFEHTSVRMWVMATTCHNLSN